MADERWPTGGLISEYGREHRKLRALWAPLVAEGKVQCTAPVCKHKTRLIRPDEPWQLGHTGDRSSYAGPQHQGCNLSDGQARAVAARTGEPMHRPWKTTQQW